MDELQIAGEVEGNARCHRAAADLVDRVLDKWREEVPVHRLRVAGERVKGRQRQEAVLAGERRVREVFVRALLRDVSVGVALKVMGSEVVLVVLVAAVVVRVADMPRDDRISVGKAGFGCET